MAAQVVVREVRYGPDASQFARLYLPAGQEPVPVGVVVHGGFWRQRYGIELADPLALDLAGRGVAGFAPEYRRVGDGGTGGWPQTLADVAAAVDQLAGAGQQAAAGRLDLDRVAAVGHSAGGHLVGWLAHRVAPVHAVRLTGAVSQAGVLDLAGAAQEGLGDGAVLDLMGGPPAALPDRYRRSSPLALVGDGARVICVHGDADPTVPLSQSRRYVAAATAAGDPAELVVLPGVGHFELIDPADAAWTVCRDAVLRLVAPSP